MAVSTARAQLQSWLPRLVLAPSFAVVLLFVYGFIIFTAYLSFTDSKMLPSFGFVGTLNYERLWKLPHWWRAVSNLAIFGSLYIVICTVLGLLLAILLDQKIRAEGVLRPIYLYPMALSFIVTGTAWKWFLDPGIGLEQVVQNWGFENFRFNWIKDRNMAIYTVVLAAVWQSSGFVMAMFLAGLRGVDNEIIRAAQIDGASNFQALSAHHHPDAAADLPVGLRRARASGHQVLRSRRGSHQRRAGAGDGAARHLHVFLHLHAQLHGHRCCVGDRDADDDRLDHHSLSLFRTQGGATHMTAIPVETEARSVDFATAGDLCRSDSLRPFLSPAALCDAGELAEAAWTRSGAAACSSCPSCSPSIPWQSAWSTAQIGVQPTGLRPYFINSILMVVPAVLISTLLGAINGYVLTKWRFKGDRLIFGLMLFACFIPFQIVLIPMAKILGLLGLAGTTFGLILVHVVYGLGFTTLFFRNYYEAFPTELVRAAMIDGANFWQIFYRILLPSSGPIFVVTVIWQFTNIWNDFLFGVSFSDADSLPMTVALNNLVSSSTGVKEYNVHFAGAILAALPTLIVYIVSGRYFVRGLMAGAVKG